MKIQLSNKAIELLVSMLAAPVWTKSEDSGKSIKLIYTAGKLISEILPDATREAPKDDPKAYDAWAEECPAEFELSDKQLDACQVAVRHFSKDGACPVIPAMVELLEKLKLAD